MAFRFSKRKKLFPGVTLNLSHRGASVRVGGRNVGATVGRKGVSATASLPGTGMSARKRTSFGKSRNALTDTVVNDDIQPAARRLPLQRTLRAIGMIAVGIVVAVAMFGTENAKDQNDVVVPVEATGPTARTGSEKVTKVASSPQGESKPVPKRVNATPTKPEPGAGSPSSAGTADVGPSEQRFVTASSLRIRDGPSTSAGVVGSVAEGDALVVLRGEGAWLNVRLPNGRTAWVHGDYLSSPTTELPGKAVALSNPAESLAPLVTDDRVVGRASVTDGDTIMIQGRKVRLHGIDTPEGGQTCESSKRTTYQCGTAATRILDRKIGNSTVSCIHEDTDRYGRTVGTCTLLPSGENLQAFMVASGFALAYRKYSTAYVRQEESARRARRGMWQGRFVAPWDWRNGERLTRPVAAVAAAPAVSNTAKIADECLIKGNVSKSGKIYHTPGSRWYSRTKISSGRGERWFCSVEEAEAAGWRAPRG